MNIPNSHPGLPQPTLKNLSTNPTLPREAEESDTHILNDALKTI